MILASDAVPDPHEWRRSFWDVAFVGVPIDDRGRAAVAFVRGRAARIVVVGAYDSKTLDLTVNGRPVTADGLGDAIVLDEGTVALEATTLGFVELFLLLRVVRRHGIDRADVLYVEPLEYPPMSSARRSILATRREFELSADVSGYRGIPGATVLLTGRSKHRAVFFVGFEERRLDVAFEDVQALRPEMCDVVFGVPAYAAGWEMNAFANNVRVLNERHVGGDLYFCSASEPAEAQSLLESVVSALRTDEVLLVAPIGTKPHGIAVAEYAAGTTRVGILYDHPARKVGRSVGVRRWHRYELRR